MKLILWSIFAFSANQVWAQNFRGSSEIFDIPQGAWTETPIDISSDHPYEDNTDQTWTLTQTGATFIRLHIAKLSLERHYDNLRITGEASRGSTYTGVENDFWTDPIPGEKVTIEFTSDGSNTDYGFDIDAYQWTSVPAIRDPY